MAVLGLAVAGAGVRLWPRSALWLDEAQSVSFARLPLLDVAPALREDGAPPLYYLLLHGWIRVFGNGDAAVRSLSAALSLAAVAVAAVAARRLGGPRAAVGLACVMLLNPFAVRYGAEARMYSLVMLEVAAGLVLLERAAREQPAPGRRTLAGIALVTAALLYTHYWSIYLLGATAAAVLIAVAGRQRRRGRWLRVLAAMAAGGVLWLPWLPTFRFQSQRTGTPWSSEPQIVNPFSAATRGAPSGADAATLALSIALGALALVAVLAALRALRARRTRPAADRAVLVTASVVVACAALATIGARLSDSATSPRYTSVMFPLVMVLAGIGLAALPTRWLRASGAAVVLALSAALVVNEIDTPRTRAQVVHAALASRARPGDLVVYCPDQLGPALERLIERDGPSGVDQAVFPAGSAPERVDWIDYEQRYADAAPAAAAARWHAAAGASTVYLVWSATYPPTQRPCSELARALARRRPGSRELVADDPRVADHAALWSFPGSTP